MPMVKLEAALTLTSQESFRHPPFRKNRIFLEESRSNKITSLKCQSAHIPVSTCNMNECPSREPVIRGRYDHFLFHSESIPNKADQLKGSKLAFLHVARSTGFFTPMIEAVQPGSISGFTFYSPCLKMLRKHFFIDKNLHLGIHDWRFLIAPRRWPKQVELSFHVPHGQTLRDQPTPYEVATAILMAPSAHFWSYDVPVDHQFKCAESTLLWWLMGLPEECIMEHLRIDEDTLHWNLAYAIRRYMTRRRFKWWALGANLRPLATDRVQETIVEAFYAGSTLKAAFEGEDRPKDLAHHLRKLDDKAPLLAQLLTGRRIGPLERPLYRPDILWRSMEEKDEWWRRMHQDDTWQYNHLSRTYRNLATTPDWMVTPDWLPTERQG